MVCFVGCEWCVYSGLDIDNGCVWFGISKYFGGFIQYGWVCVFFL